MSNDGPFVLISLDGKVYIPYRTGYKRIDPRQTPAGWEVLPMPLHREKQVRIDAQKLRGKEAG